MKEIYAKILQIFLSAKTENIHSLKTRDVADAVDLTIYQARQHLEYLCEIGIIERLSHGKGKSVIWSLA